MIFSQFFFFENSQREVKIFVHRFDKFLMAFALFKLVIQFTTAAAYYGKPGVDT